MVYTFTSHEVKIEIDSLQELVGMRLGNIHQIEKELFIIKFWKLGVSRNLIVENGVRFHLTDFPREKPKTPPDFCVRLRKLLRFRKLDDIIQPENDRAVYFCFGELYLCFELFQGGNIILFNNTDKIIQGVLKYHIISGKTIIGVNQPYNYEQFRPYISPTDEEIHQFFQTLDPAEPKIRTTLQRIFPNMRQDFFISSLTIAKINPDLSIQKYKYNFEQINIFISEMRKFEFNLLSKPEIRPPRTENDEEKKQIKHINYPKPKGYLYINGKIRFLSGYNLSQWDPKFVKEFDTFDKACDEFWSAKELETAQKTKTDHEKIPEKKVKGVQRNFDKKKKTIRTRIN